MKYGRAVRVVIAGAMSLAASCTSTTSTSSATSSATMAATATSSAAQLAEGTASARSAVPLPSSAAVPAPDSGTIPGLYVPNSIGVGRAPFILLLHGYGGRGATIARHFGFEKLAEERRFLFAAPDGVMDSRGARFWNAGAACCDFEQLPADHVAELRALLNRAKQHPSVDPSRIYVVGYSNGAFMAHRLACDVDGIAGIASVAGAGPQDTQACKFMPSTILEAHGDDDDAVRYEGGQVLDRASLPRHASAVETVTAWARKAGCEQPIKASSRIDLDARLVGPETEPLSFSCAPGVKLLRVTRGTHGILSDRESMGRLLDLLMAPAAP